MKKLNLTEGPWKLEREAEIFKGNRLIADCCDYGVNNSEEYISESKSNAQAIVKAVNNTYHKGIDPEGVPDMKEALIEAYKAINNLPDEALGVKAVNNGRGEPEPEPIKFELMYRLQEALKKAGVNLNSKAE